MDSMFESRRITTTKRIALLQAVTPLSPKIPAPEGVTRTSQRIEKPIPRAALTDEEMQAIMVRVCCGMFFNAFVRNRIQLC